MDKNALNVVGALAVACGDVITSAMAESGLDLPSLAVLLATYARPDSTISQVAHVAGFTHSGTVRVVDRLAGQALLERAEGHDRRTVFLRCTPEGVRQARAALAAREHAIEGLLSVLAPSDLSALRTIGAKILAAIPDDRAHAWRICRLCDHGVCRGSACPVGSAVAAP